MKIRILQCGVVLGVLCLSACVSVPKRVGMQRVVERTPASAPSWVEKSEWEKSQQLFFTGAVAGVTDRALGLREARAEGEKKVAEKIREKIRTEFGSALEGQNRDQALGSYVKDVIAKVSENVEVSGVSQAEQYIEKVEEQVSHGVRYIYNCHVLLSLAKDDYAEARRWVFEGAVEKANKERNLKAEASLKDAFERLNKNEAVKGED